MIIRVLFSFLAISAASGNAFHPGDEISKACGGQARFVWCQDAGNVKTRPGAALRLMGFDTNDGRGERNILAETGNFAKPLLTPDGEKVIFSTWPEHKVYSVNFDGSDLKLLTDGYAVAVWHEGLTETDWIYAGTMTNTVDPFMINLRRFRLDNPEISEPVWSKTPLHTDNIQLSADGLHASGLFPWPACGIAELPNREWKKYGDGCWPSLSPDNQLLFWIFDGAHRNLAMFRAGTDERWTVNINSAPGIDGYEVYHPRWSNHALFMVMTGPYKIGEGANRIRGGGPEVEIYMGKFTPDFRKIELWIRVTSNHCADFYPDLWVASAPSATQNSFMPHSVKSNISASDSVWPIAFERMYFYWQDKAGANSFTDPATGEAFVCRVEARGRAMFGRHFEMAPSGGAFLAEGGAGNLAQKCAESGQLALEATLVSDSTARTNLLPVLGYAADSGDWNFLLGQQNGGLVFQARAADGSPDYMIPLGPFDSQKPCHIIISCSTSSVACYMNGKTVLTKNGIYGGNWKPGRLVFGNDLRKEYSPDKNYANAWKGLLKRVAVYARWIGPAEAQKKFQALKADLDKMKPIQPLAVKAKLIAAPDIPAPASIAPYRRGMAVERYAIEQKKGGDFASRELLVARWVIMDGQILESAIRRTGETYDLLLEPFAEHPELEGERQIIADDQFDLPLYYEPGFGLNQFGADASR